MTSVSFASKQGNTSPNVSHGAPQQAQALDSDALKAASDAAYVRMRDAFIKWHVFGCFAAAAEYSNARMAWELALMEQGDRG